MILAPYVTFSSTQLEKVGNTIVYLAESIPNLSKDKLLQLLYILDEISIKKSGIPILNLTYKVWKLGPVSEELFIELSSEPTMLSKYIDFENNGSCIKSKIAFEDDEFSDNDLEMIDFIIERFGHQSVKELTTYTQRINSPWYKTAKGNLVFELFVNGIINNTEYVIDMGQIVSYDDRKFNIYKEYVESH